MVNNAILTEYIKTADLGIISRLNNHLNHELSLPNRVFEFINANLPIVSSKLPDLSKFILNQKIGYVFDINKPNEVKKNFISY